MPFLVHLEPCIFLYRVLHDNKISDIGDYAFLGLKSLRILELNKNRLKHMPTSLSHLESLVELDLDENDIETLPDNSFSRNRKLTLIQLHKNPIRSIGTRAFSHLPSLEKIVLSEVTNMFSFPDLNGTFNLTQIRLDRASIKVVPPGICHHRPWLKS
ncbi:leucine-rich repeat-containing G-protein coupled receptor 5-like, partial [Littorina saxatilis]|uniref:leucine-rich repeat-containing G-protein coupled receptor 5-like n=1 Tax=Littorina saxatilis TaxID=31220 RepID=UPI0038B6AB67